VTPGGAERVDSVRAGLKCLPFSCDRVAIHDAARPYVKPAIISAALEALKTHHGSVPGLALVDTLRVHDESVSGGCADRSRYILTQTPQCFHRQALESALQHAAEEGFTGTDDAAYIERLPGARVAIVAGDPDNFKITTEQDLRRAKAMVSGRNKAAFRVGEGFDAHRFSAGRPLILGGVTIPFERGLLGHSDADVLCHSIGDALLGAASLGDLGAHFPDSDPAFKGISSLLLLEKIGVLLRQKEFTICNVDATLTLESPRIAPHRQVMIANIAGALKLPESAVSVKATTTEGMGFEGRGEGISCRAVALVKG
jgi:2-C-methyl-D-erythritol 4-phosphate cytidylyltransferase / 2-C-methyl-D-erythritol 2,4-cyclodiphosphate synthase